MTKKRVIILEDEPGTLELEEAILCHEGFDVIPINQYKPLEYLIDFKPDLVLLDVRLAGGYGHILCSDFKANPLTNHISIVLVSGSPNLEHIASGCKADGYLSKPFSVEELISTVKNNLTVNENQNYSA